MVKKSPRLPLSPLQLGLVAGITLLVAFCFGYTGRLIANSEVQAQVAQWETEVTVEQARVEDHKARLDYVKSDAYVRDAASRELGWTFPDEVAIWVVGELEAEPVATATVQSTMPSWQLWWERFFGR